MEKLQESKILITGGSGLLGTALKKVLPNALYPTHNEFDITKETSLIEYFKKKDWKLDIDTIFHGAAFTSPPKIEENPERALSDNIEGTSAIVKLCMTFNFRLVYMSTDYVFKGDQGNYLEDAPVYPVNKYAWSKLGGECAVRLYDNSLIIRTSMSPEPFPYEKAFIDQIATKEYISKVALKTAKLIKSDLTGTIHIGGKRQRIYHFARETKPDVGELFTSEVNFKVPKDVSLNQRRWDKWAKK